jgi:hypothetical protein
VSSLKIPLIISRMLTKHFRSELFDDSDHWSSLDGNDCYYYYCHLLSKYHCFLQSKIKIFSKSYKESGIKIITINWNITISCIYEWIKCCQIRTTIIRIYILTNPVLINDTTGFYTCLQFDKAGFQKRLLTSSFRL